MRTTEDIIQHDGYTLRRPIYQPGEGLSSYSGMDRYETYRSSLGDLALERIAEANQVRQTAAGKSARERERRRAIREQYEAQRLAQLRALLDGPQGIDLAGRWLVEQTESGIALAKARGRKGGLTRAARQREAA